MNCKRSSLICARTAISQILEDVNFPTYTQHQKLVSDIQSTAFHRVEFPMAKINHGHNTDNVVIIVRFLVSHSTTRDLKGSRPPHELRRLGRSKRTRAKMSGVVEGSGVKRRAKSVLNTIRAPKSVPNSPQSAPKCV